MSVDGTKLLYEGFLQKRKDTLKIIWVTYWFRLQNTTLFFYIKKNGNASHLRGHYYIYTVQSVREVQKTGRKHFMFEIVMTNGKRKMLAAETAALRKEWVTHLWQAMHLSGSGVLDSGATDLEVSEQQENLNSKTSVCSDSDSVMEQVPPLSARTPSNHTCPEASSTTSPICPEASSTTAPICPEASSTTAPICPEASSTTAPICPEASSTTAPICPSEELHSEEASYQIVQLPFNDQNLSDHSISDLQWSSGLSSAPEAQDGVYDVLPRRSYVQECDDPSTEVPEDVYDTPISYRTSFEHQDPTDDDDVYDVPSCLLRQTCDLTIDEQPEEGIYDSISVL